MRDRDGLQDSAYGWVKKHDSVKRKRADGKKWMIGNLNEERKRRKVGDDKRNGMIGISMNKENGRKVGVTKEMG